MGQLWVAFLRRLEQRRNKQFGRDMIILKLCYNSGLKPLVIFLLCFLFLVFVSAFQVLFLYNLLLHVLITSFKSISNDPQIKTNQISKHGAHVLLFNFLILIFYFFIFLFICRAVHPKSKSR